jgi:hypothetical protein
MIWENSYGHRMPKGLIANVPVRPTRTNSNVRVTSALLLKTDSQQKARRRLSFFATRLREVCRDRSYHFCHLTKADHQGPKPCLARAERDSRTGRPSP